MFMNSIFSPLRRMLAVASMACSVAGAYAQTDGYDLYVSYTDSVEVSLDLAHLRSLTFSYRDRSMTAHYRDGSNSILDYSRIGKLYFDAATNGVAPTEVEAKGAFFTLSGDMLTLHAEPVSAALYSPNGALVTSLAGRVVSLAGLPAGIYILRVDNQIAKICLP